MSLHGNAVAPVSQEGASEKWKKNSQVSLRKLAQRRGNFPLDKCFVWYREEAFGRTRFSMPRRKMLCIPDKISLACVEFLHHRALAELEPTGITASSQLAIRKKNVSSQRTQNNRRHQMTYSALQKLLYHTEPSIQIAWPGYSNIFLKFLFVYLSAWLVSHQHPKGNLYSPKEQNFTENKIYYTL